MARTRVKKLCSVVSLITVFAVLLSVSTVCFAVDQKQAQEEAFAALPEDAVVCYLRGVPVYKYEIDENRRIVKESTPITRISGETDTLPVAHRGAIVISAIQTAAVGNSQFEYINYLPNKYAEAAANGFEDIGGVTGIVGLITDAGGLIPNTIVQGISMVIGGILGLTGVVSGDISGDIRDITDNGGDIILSYVNTKFGGFYSVEEWDGKTCVRFPIEVPLGFMVVDTQCAHGSPWGD